MGGLCGWIGDLRSDDGPPSVGARMAGGLPQVDRGRTSQAFQRRHALAVRAPARLGHWFDDDGLLVAIHGYPYWPDAQRQAAAERDGHAQVAARLYRDKGADLLTHLQGPFALCVIEKAVERALLAIDRFGVESLSYTQVPNGPLVFGSTADSVRAHPGVMATIAPQTIYNYLYFIDRICAPATIYDEQKKLVPGQYLLFERGAARLETYWRMPYGADDTHSEAELGDALLDRLRDALGRSIAGEEPARTGAFLSGGLDSSTVVSLLAEKHGRGTRAFTIGFKEQAFDETPYAALAAKHVGAAHDIYYLDPDPMVDAIPRLSQAYDEPFANSSVVPAYYCAVRAKETGIDVLLAGDGGDELFAGNARYLKDRIFQHYGRIPRLLRTALIEPAVRHFPLGERIGLLRKARSYIRQANQSIPVRLSATNVYATLAAGDLFAPDLMAEIDAAWPMRFVEDIYFGTGAVSDLQRMMAVDLRITLADSDLRKIGRACDMAGVRVRYPFLDESLAEFAARVPPQLLVKNGELRYFFKAALGSILAEATITKKKHGFGLPTFAYINKHKPLQDLFCDSLGALKRRHLFRDAALDGVIAQVRAGQAEAYCGVAWDLGVFELWLQSHSPVVFDGSAGP